MVKRIRRRCSSSRNQIEIVKVYRDLNSDDEELPLPENVDRRREAAVSPVSAVVRNMEHQSQREPLGQRKPLWAKDQKQVISELFEGYG